MHAIDDHAALRKSSFLTMLVYIFQWIMTCIEFWHQSATDIDEEEQDDGNLASKLSVDHAVDDVRDGKQELEAGPTAKRKRLADSESLSSMKKRLTAANAAKKIETDGKINSTDQINPIGQLALLCTGKYILKRLIIEYTALTE